MMTAPKKLTKAEAGRLGGNTTKRRHGTEHYRRAGKLGFLATVARPWQGDREGYLRWLRANGWEAEIRRHLADMPVDPRTGTTSIEIPFNAAIDDPEELPL